jgi:hypothetical protein
MMVWPNNYGVACDCNWRGHLVVIEGKSDDKIWCKYVFICVFISRFVRKDEGWAMFLKNYVQRVVMLMELS